MTTDIVEQAREFAIKAHAGLVRPNKAREPYHVHCKEVADLVTASGGSPEEIAAAWLHDTVEDTSTTFADIENQFGVNVAAIVEGLTDPPDIGKFATLDRKRFQADRVRNESDSIKRVKLADQTSNVRSVAVDPPTKWTEQKCIDYVTGAGFIAHECHGISTYLDVEFDKAYVAALRAHS
jgi:guanosine-3',5'-bis(diphosphate) 3'-pyrophosphohydrolase